MNIKEEFPIFETHPNLIYLDSAATTQKPISVISAITDYYKKTNANIHRGLYELSETATNLYSFSRKKVARFINANSQEIIFTRNATESINLVAYSWARDNLKKGDKIIISIMEHHSNIVPWQILREEKGIEIEFIDITENYELDLNHFDQLLDEKVKLVAVNHVSNTLGTVNPIETIIDRAHKQGAKVLIDSCQSISHLKTDVKKLGCDFLVFSGHKMFGPMGIGVLFVKEEILKNMKPFLTGGDMIKSVSKEKVEWNDLPWKFEAGTPNLAGVIGLKAAIEYIENEGFEVIHNFEKAVMEMALKDLNKLDFIKIIGPNDVEKQIGIISFVMDSVHAHDVAASLSEKNICVRAGKHCTHPLFDRLGISSTVRISFSLYNYAKEMDLVISELKRIYNFFN